MLPPHLHVHDVFHVNLLKTYVPNLEHILDLDDTLLANQEEFIITPERILDTKEKELRNKKIPLVKVLWRNHEVEEATWEREEEMKMKYPHLFG